MSNRGKILIVDDEPRNVKLLTAYLKPDNFEPICAYDGIQAIELALTEQPDVILLDIMMPDMDGFEVTKRLKADTATSHIPIVLVTSLDGSDNRTHGLDSGADEFLTKPVNRPELLARVNALLRMKKLNEELKNRQNIVDSISASGLIEKQAEYTVLLVEDDKTLCKRVEKILLLSNIECLVAASAEQANHLLNSKHPDLILLDRILPDADGIDFLKSIKRNPNLKDIPVIIITSLSDLGPKITGIESGADDYLIKPVEHAELVARIRAGLRRYSATRHLKHALSQAQTNTVTDKLTGVRNRYYLDADLDYRVAQAKRMQQKSLSILMIDIDHFKDFNDNYGHLVGDQVLCAVANQFMVTLRAADVVTRFGGEEFCIILPDTEINVAHAIAERIREEIESMALPDLEGVHVTVSIGVAEISFDDENAKTFLSRADEALYQSKSAGRNKVSLAKSENSIN